MAGTYEVPLIGSSNETQEPKVKTFIESWNNKLSSENKLEDSGVASPNNGAYRLVFNATSLFGKDAIAATYIVGSGNAGVAVGMVASGANLESGASTGTLPIFYFDDADYTVAGKTQKLRVRAQIGANLTKPALKFTFGLYPVTVAGGIDVITLSLGTVVSGSTVELNEPAASTVTQGNSGDFTIPADGAYALGVVTSATMTNNSTAVVSAQLQTRSV